MTSWIRAAMAACLTLAAMVAMGDTPAAAPTDELRELQVIAGIPDEIRPVAKEESPLAEVARAASLEEAIFQRLGMQPARDAFIRDGETLKIYTKAAPEVAAGTVLLAAAVRSDCPNNTQFKVDGPVAISQACVKDALAEWTRHRHKAPSAPLRVVNLTEFAANDTNYDVQLDLQRLSHVQRR